MSLEKILDANKTITPDIIKTIDLGMDTQVQSMLIPFYQEFPFLSNTLWDIPYANLIAASVTFLFFLVLRHIFTTALIYILQKIADHTNHQDNQKIINAFKEPLRFFFIIIGLHLFFVLTFSETETIALILTTLTLYTFFWGILSLTEALRGAIYALIANFNRDLSREVGNFAITLFKIIIVGVEIATIMHIWGVNVTALVASLGIGGLVFAFAAKDTAANLFGSFSLLVDRSFRIGEWIKVKNYEGTVEYIGMRTTRIRAFDHSLISIPNSLVASEPIENYSRRNTRRFKITIQLTYDTLKITLQEIVSAIKTMLQLHPLISQTNTLLVNFDAFGDSSLDIFIYAFTATADWEQHQKIKEDVHFKIMEIVEHHGALFAFPSQTLYFANKTSKETKKQN